MPTTGLGYNWTWRGMEKMGGKVLLQGDLLGGGLEEMN